jgi:hypothetical protein
MADKASHGQSLFANDRLSATSYSDKSRLAKYRKSLLGLPDTPRAKNLPLAISGDLRRKTLAGANGAPHTYLHTRRLLLLLIAAYVMAMILFPMNARLPSLRWIFQELQAPSQYGDNRR